MVSDSNTGHYALKIVLYAMCVCVCECELLRISMRLHFVPINICDTFQCRMWNDGGAQYNSHTNTDTGDTCKVTIETSTKT